MWRRRQDENRKREDGGLGWADGNGGGVKQKDSGEMGGRVLRTSSQIGWVEQAGQRKEGTRV